MNPPKCDDQDYINFLVATPRAFSALEAARVQPAGLDPPAHDAFTRLLHRLEPDPAILWHEAQGEVQLDDGLLVFDDSTLDHLSARQIEYSTTGCWSLTTRRSTTSRRARSSWSRAIGRVSITRSCAGSI